MAFSPQFPIPALGKNKNTKVRRIIHKLPSTVRDKALIYLANGTDCTISDQGHTQV
ncbi:Uncharacterised protein [Vibrio cholerae]|uniref:Uncharacterized protein n=1 Tax=Vibrio cholerae TaxID=666 RepID=A0A655XYB9_VIBCL|nr:Uncharacterised protein [Vibrio cholerae]CSA83961.1 Uncharacterised protein [Vibrio cholerae]CSC24087.1 Uncharacterised protein [Vibrio cholerae]CSC36804.1 Uncharacterised protein [Vibrio cholerae]CSI61679.1 Uncharacterised protein [Vibrio cholerae]